MLGGPEMAINSRLSPDGHLLAFLAMVDGLTQVAVMKPESGNWTILTRDRSRGQAFSVSWSPDGALIYYTRSNGATKGVYSVPLLGGDEHLVLDNAGNSEAMLDGSLIVAKVSAERKRKLHRFWPGTGRMEEIAIQTVNVQLREHGFQGVPGWQDRPDMGPARRTAGVGDGLLCLRSLFQIAEASQPAGPERRRCYCIRGCRR